MVLSLSAMAVNIKTDREWYLAGEQMKVSVTVYDSQIAYAELCDANGLAASTIVGIKDGVGKGTIELPANLHSGFYALNVYTRNSSEVCNKLVAVVNTMSKSGDDDVVRSVMLFFASRLSELRSQGVADVIVDPGFGFGKNLRQNYELMHHLDYMGETGCPVLVGVSRKSMLTKLLKIKPDEALSATTALHVMALERGASILRVHDAGAAREAIALWQAVNHPQDIE